MISYPLKQQQQQSTQTQWSELYFPPDSSEEAEQLDSAVSGESNVLLSKYSIQLPSVITSMAARDENVVLGRDYEPSDYDVVCGRGKGSYNRPGNLRFRQIVRDNIPTYHQARTKYEKSTVLNNIIDYVRSSDNGSARFIKFDTKTREWYELSDDQAREKVGHTIRESIQSIDNAKVKFAKKKVFNAKHTDLLTQQQAIFSDLATAETLSCSKPKTQIARSA